MITEDEINRELKKLNGDPTGNQNDNFWRTVLTELLAYRKLLTSEDEILIALKRVEGYEDVDPLIIAEDALISPEIWTEWRLINRNHQP